MNSLLAVGERLLLARRKMALTQKELADLAGVTALTISRIERGEGDGLPRPGTVRGLAKALGVTPAWLLYGDETGKPLARIVRARGEVPDRIVTAEGASILPKAA